MVTELVGKNGRRRAFGLYELFGNLGATMGPLTGGYLYDFSRKMIPFNLNGAVSIVNK